MNVNNPARQWLSQERGTITRDWGGRISIALIFPNKYYLGMSSLGYQTIYSIFNSYDEIVCERVFLDSGGKSIESGRPLDDFSILAFSISSEMDYFNAIDILSRSSTPVYSSERGDMHPVVIAGGPCVTANPEPLAPFFDGFAIGEGEAILPNLIETVTTHIGDGRDALIEAISKLPGMYVPQLRNSETIVRQWARDIDDFATTTAILTPNTEFSDMYLIEIARGCRWGCRFCLAGFHFRPLRFRSLDNLIEQSENGLKYTRKVGLLGASPFDHPEIDDLVAWLQQREAQISISSLRIRPLSRVSLRGLVQSGTRTLSLAPEAASQRLRNVINKGISEKDIVEAVEWVAEHPPRQLKLYFMIGLPTETEEDIEEMVRLTTDLKERLDRKRAGCRLTLTIEPFVPKAGTPFQWLPMANSKTLRHRLSYLKRTLERRGIEVRSESVPWAAVQGVLSRGDRRLATALVQVSRERTLSSWRQALSELSIDADFYTGREIPLNERLPWSYIDSGVKLDYLESELERAGKGRPTPPCPTIECHKCGVC